MRQVNKHDKKTFEVLYKKMEGIKKELKHSHSLDILQAIIARYNLTIKDQDVILHTETDRKIQKQLNKITKRIDQLIFDAWYKQLETVKHELKHCNNVEQLDILVRHIDKINLDKNAALRYVTKNHSANNKILNLELALADRLLNKKKELGSKQEDWVQISESWISDTEAEDLNNPHGAYVMVDNHSSEQIVSIELQESPISTEGIDDSGSISKSVPISKISDSNISEPQIAVNAAEESYKIQLLTLQQQKERDIQLRAFDKVLKQLVSKRDEFHLNCPKDSKEDATKAYGAAYLLVNKLTGFSHVYKEGWMDLKTFKELTIKEIQQQRQGVLSKHRGCKELLANLLFAIGTLGMGYALAALYTQSFLPIRVNTDTANCLDDALKSVEFPDSGLTPM
ncbi:hypothetical protein [uncultured Legionella sp.]|uniref:hypothetical protein n=1 Tax=uncultured Legionella sp. TaxID=210934 RepID=UPI00260D32A5|nr:hypothetical protein [uncultured Legionella sp.]